MAFKGGLKTFNNFHTRGLGSILKCFLCSTKMESHSHLFFECELFMKIIQCPVLSNDQFLLNSTLRQALGVIENTACKQIIRLCFIIIFVTIYIIWRERNR